MTGRYENVSYNKACLIINAIVNGKITWGEVKDVEVKHAKKRCGFYHKEKCIGVYDERKELLVTY